MHRDRKGDAMVSIMKGCTSSGALIGDMVTAGCVSTQRRIHGMVDPVEGCTSTVRDRKKTGSYGRREMVCTVRGLLHQHHATAVRGEDFCSV